MTKIREAKAKRMGMRVFSTFLICSLILLLIVPVSAEENAKDSLSDQTTSQKFASREILVKFKDGVSEKSIDSLNRKKGAKTKETIDEVEVERIQVDSNDSVSEALDEYRRNSKVEYAEPNYVFNANIVPNDYYYASYQWNMPIIDAPAAWDSERGDTNNAVVAVIDTGVDLGHPDLDSKIVPGYNFAYDNSDPSDDNGHGTHVAGIIGAESNNGQGVAGVSWGAKIMPVKVLNSWGSGYLSDVASGIIYAADNGADVINMSLGSSYNSGTLQSAVDYAYNKGVTIVAASGNGGNSTMNYPAGCNNVIGVGATDQNDIKASFSTYNSSVDVSAPGVSIASTWYRGSGYSYALASGTSMATPHVAGLAALLVSEDPSRHPDDIEDLMKLTADDLGSSGRDDYYGAGRINAELAVAEDENFVASRTWYFAEGYTGDGFEEWLTLQNPTNSSLTVHITYMFRDGLTRHRHVIVDAQSRQTVDVNHVVGANKEFSMKVEASADIVAERPMYFNYKGSWSDGHDTIGATSTSNVWYFAEGYTGDGFEEWLTIQNPGGSTAHTTITYMFKGGGTQSQSIAIAASSRETISVNTVVGAGKDVSIKVESSQPIVAERPMYFNYKGVWAGGHNTIGATSTSNVWYFAEGYTGDGFEEWLTIQNPGGSTAHTTITYMFKGGGTQSQSIAIAASSRETISVNTVVGAGKDVSIKVESSQPIVAERPMYFNYKGNWSGGHDTIGASSASTVWYFAEGHTGDGFEEWLTLQNPNGTTAHATVTYMFGEGGTQSQSVALAANSRETIDVNTAVGTGKDVSIKVESTQPIVAERPMYFNYKGSWAGGHNTTGSIE